MIITKEIKLKIEMSGDDFQTFKELLENILAANTSANQGLGFLKTHEEKYIEKLLKSLNDEQKS